MARLRLVIICLLLFGFILNANANYPEKTEYKYVNDFAGILTKEDIKKLNDELKDYNIRTSNEIIVVTVNSLEKMTIEDYTLGLANYWGVGKSGRDNGVVFLVAPNEGEMRIEVGKGLENILTQRILDNIRDNDIIPYFRQDEMNEGIFSGARSIIQNIDKGNIKSSTTQKIQPVISEKGAKTVFYMMIFIFIGILIFGSSIWMRNKSKFKKENAELLEQLQTEKQYELSSRYQESKIQLESLKRNNPLSVWEELEKAYNTIVFEDIDQKINSIKIKHSQGKSDVTRTMINDLEKEINSDIDTCKKIGERIGEVEKAKKESIQYFKQLPDLMKETENIVNHPDVFGKTNTLFDGKNFEIKKIEKSTEGEPSQIDWLKVYSELKGIISDLNDIQRKAESDKAMANRARIEGPKILMDMPRLIEETEKELASSNEEMLIKAKNEYHEVSSRNVSEIETYLRLIAIRDILDNAREEHRSRIAAEKRRRSSYSHSSYSSSRGGSFGGHGSSGSFRSGGGGSFGGHGSSGKWK